MWAFVVALTLLNASLIAETQHFTDHPYILGELKLDSYVQLESNKVFRSLNMSNEKASITGKTTLSFADLLYASFSGSSMRGNTDNGFANAFTELVFEGYMKHNLRRSWQEINAGYIRHMYPNQSNQTYGELYITYQLNGYNLSPYVSYYHQMNQTIKPSTYNLSASNQTKQRRDNIETGISYHYDNATMYANMGDWKDTGRYYKLGASYCIYAYTFSYEVINTKDYNNVKDTQHVVRLSYASDAKLPFTGLID